MSDPQPPEPKSAATEPCESCGWPGEAVTRLDHTLWNIRRTTFDRAAADAESHIERGRE